MHYALDTLERLRVRAWIPKVPMEHLEVGLPLHRLEPATAVEEAVEHAHALSLREKAPHEDRADVSGSAGHENRRGSHRRTKRWRWWSAPKSASGPIGRSARSNAAARSKNGVRRRSRREVSGSAREACRWSE